MELLVVILYLIASFMALEIGIDIVYKSHNYKSFWFGIKLIIGSIICITTGIIVVLF